MMDCLCSSTMIRACMDFGNILRGMVSSTLKQTRELTWRAFVVGS
jgi:hypothetical protein